jgi:hypothetical protein
MPRVALSENVKALGTKINEALPWAEIVLKNEDGSVNVKDTQHGLVLGLKAYLKSIGQRFSPRGGAVNWAALQQAALFVFSKEANTRDAALPLQAIIYGTVAAMKTDFSQYDKARKLVAEAIGMEGSYFEIVRTKGVGTASVKLKSDLDLAALKDKANAEPMTWEAFTADEEEDGEEGTEDAAAAAPAPVAAAPSAPKSGTAAPAKTGAKKSAK